ncbi:V-type ATPase subunit [Vagococcus lutrae]|uniref:V-type ATPase subunit n=1 Tax=Vagococcus lutrae TaxID=81947 RepID=UPI0020985EF5|nr:V-type ATPase subunit [Vagococcus lutrae]MCO7150107.1 V-type ATPase subunit [Vagococcus lutrae]MDT2818212.1 V-type ATPase subunit [Vagococcus lutrae]MDT2843221.1 V-type ATPase subunit [Vagococcus lutrae]WCG05518.1 V-type ATPase subunit [Vagococcus lutrae]
MAKDTLIQTNVQVSVRESQLLSEETVDRLIQANSYEEAIQVMLDSSYARYFRDNQAASLSDIFARIRVDLLDWAYKINQHQLYLADIFAASELFHNVKCVLKEKITGQSLRELRLEGSRYTIQEIESLVQTSKQGRLPDEVREAVYQAISSFGEWRSLQRVELIVDQFYFEYIRRLTNQANSSDVTSFVQTWIDLHNIAVLLQLPREQQDIAQLAFIEGGNISESSWMMLYQEPVEAAGQFFATTDYHGLWQQAVEPGGLDQFDKAVDNWLMKRLSGAMISPFGVEKYLGYMVAKQMEIKNLRLILFAKRSGLAEDQIEKRVRRRYEL